MAITVAIVEDIKEIREGLSILINGSDGFHCIATYPTAESALEGLKVELPDVMLMDIQLPGMSGIECVRRIKAEYPKLQVMMQTIYEDDERIYDSLVAGASGYILKKMPPAKILEAIQDLHTGGSPMSSQIARKVVQTFYKLGTSSKETENLTAREYEILSFLAKGYRYKEIADLLYISVETVRTHIHKIYEKLHVRSRTEAVLKYLNR